MVRAHWPLGCLGLGSLGRLLWGSLVPWRGLLDHAGAGGCLLCCGAAGAGNTRLVVRCPWLGHSAGRQESRALGLTAPRALGCLAEGWDGPRVSARTQPLCLMPSSSWRGHDSMRSQGQAPTTSWSPSSGPGRCLTTGVRTLDGHPPSYLHLHPEGPREQG